MYRCPLQYRKKKDIRHSLHLHFTIYIHKMPVCFTFIILTVFVLFLLFILLFLTVFALSSLLSFSRSLSFRVIYIFAAIFILDCRLNLHISCSVCDAFHRLVGSICLFMMPFCFYQQLCSMPSYHVAITRFNRSTNWRVRSGNLKNCQRRTVANLMRYKLVT